MTAEVETCERCRRTVRNTLTERNGRPMPVDLVPTADGTIELLPVAFGLPVSRVRRDPAAPGEVRYRVHWASCPPSSARRPRHRPGRR